MRLIDANVLIRKYIDPDIKKFSNSDVKIVLENLKQNILKASGIELVRCKDCKHRIVNEHYGEKGYMKLKAMCELDTGDIFQLGRHAEDDEWYCADAERKTPFDPSVEMGIKRMVEERLAQTERSE